MAIGISRNDVAESPRNHYSNIDEKYDRAKEDGLIRIVPPHTMDKADCIASVDRWQQFAITHPEFHNQLVANKRIARALIAYEQLTVSFCIGNKVRVFNPKRKEFMQEIYSITKVIRLNGGIWYALENAIGRTLSPRKAGYLKAIS